MVQDHKKKTFVPTTIAAMQAKLFVFDVFERMAIYKVFACAD